MKRKYKEEPASKESEEKESTCIASDPSEGVRTTSVIPTGDASEEDTNVAVAAAELVHLGPDLLTRISTYFEMLVHNDLFNFCVAVGLNTKDDATPVVCMRLSGNGAFLRYSLLRAIDPNDIQAQRKGKAGIVAWMDANNWKDRVTDEKIDWSKRHSLVTDVEVRGSELKQLQFTSLMGGYSSCERWGKRGVVDIVSIGNDLGNDLGTDRICRVMKLAEIHSTVSELFERPYFYEEMTYPVSLIQEKNIDVIFANPLVAAELGLVEVLRFLVEQKGLGAEVAHSNIWDGVRQPSRPVRSQFVRDHGTYHLPLLVNTFLYAPDDSTFDYLASLVDISAPMPPHRLMVRSFMYLLHFVSEVGVVPRNNRIEHLLGHPNVDINAQDGVGNTALHSLFLGNERRTRGHVELLSILLESGADLNKCNNLGRRPLDVAINCHSRHGIYQDQGCTEMIAILEEFELKDM